MNIAKGKEAEIAAFLIDRQWSGDNWLAYHEKAIIYDSGAIPCFPDKLRAEQYASTSPDPMSVMPIDSAVSELREQNIQSVLGELKASGFEADHLGGMVRKNMRFPDLEEDTVVRQKKDGHIFSFYLYFQADQNQFVSFSHFNGTIRTENPPFEHGIFGGTDTRELEKRMEAVDWGKHPGHYTTQQADAEIRRIERDLKNLGSQKSQVARKAFNALTIRFFAGTPLESAPLAELSYRIQQHERWLSFPKEMHMDQAAVALFGAVEKPQIEPPRCNPFEDDEELLKTKFMNTQNVEFLQSQLKNFGFGETLNKELSEKVAQGNKEFSLHTEIPHFNNRLDCTLYLRKSDTSDMYFINKYDASLKHSDQSLDKSQTFYVNNGSSITAKEAFNLLEGRAVHKDLKTQEQVKYKAWLKLDFDTKTDSGNHKIKQFGEKYGYDLGKSLNGFAIKELADPTQKTDLMRSLERGNVQSVTVVHDGGKEGRYFIEASPQYKNVNVYDHKMNGVKRDTIKEAKKGENTSQVQDSKASLDKKQKADQKEDPVEQNKRSRKKGVKV